jgi:uncharacterized membrane protein
MASNLYRHRPEVERKFVDLELRERRFALMCRAILLVLAVGLVLATIICALCGEASSVTTVAGGSSALTGIIAAVSGPKSQS